MGQTMIALECYWCGEETKKVAAEIRRQQKKGKRYFFCSLSCAVRFGNSRRDDLRKKVRKTCPWCGEDFKTMTGAKSPTFCSRSCASAGSVTEARRQAGRNARKNLDLGNEPEAKANALWARESWKYKKVQKLLDALDEDYDFEHPLKGTRHIFDLALLDHKILVEFDGRYHRSPSQTKSDKKKSQAARKQGWRVKRVRTSVNKVLGTKAVKRILGKVK